MCASDIRHQTKPKGKENTHKHKKENHLLRSLSFFFFLRFSHLFQGLHHQPLQYTQGYQHQPTETLNTLAGLTGHRTEQHIH